MILWVFLYTFILLVAVNTNLNFSVVVQIFLTAFFLFLCFFKKIRLVQYMLPILTALITFNFSVDYHQSLKLSENIYRKPLLITGEITKISSAFKKSAQFNFKIERLCEKDRCVKTHKLVTLSWYNYPHDLKVHEHWQLWVLFKPWHGFNSPGAFNQELTAFLSGIAAKGSVKKSGSNQLLFLSNHYDLMSLRQKINELFNQILPVSKNERAIIKTLVLSNKEDLSAQLLQLFQGTGTSHLLAISGMHVGLLAAIGFMVSHFLWRRFATLCLLWPAKNAAILGSILFALLYCLLAGFSLPTVRALIMILVGCLGQFLHYQFSPLRSWLVAFLLTVLMFPLSVIQASFWLSYIAVLIIYFSIAHRFYSTKKYAGFKIQWYVTLGLMPITLFFFTQTSLISFIANIIAIPLVSFFILPLSLLGTILLGINLKLASWILIIDSYMIKNLIIWLKLCTKIPFHQWFHDVQNPWVFISSLLGTFILLLPRSLKLNALGIIFYLPVFFYKPLHLKPAQLLVTFLDVGQGLSVVVQTKAHVLVYDLGPAYPSGFNTSAMVVLPYLRFRQIKQIDMLMISHQDMDHLGNWQIIKKFYPEAPILSSATKKIPSHLITACQAGQHWRWDGVSFQVLWPEVVSGVGDNDQSCVLQISNGARTILLTGDIEMRSEEVLVKHRGATLKADLMIAPHHGSRTSSSPGFIAAIQPRHVVISAGLDNRYRLPNQEVIDRYIARQAVVSNIAETGTLSYFIEADGQMQGPNAYRKEHPKFWYFN